MENQSADPHVHQLAIRLARACRHIVQACLREEEWGEADREFYKIIRPGLEDMQRSEPPGKHVKPTRQSGWGEACGG